MSFTKNIIIKDLQAPATIERKGFQNFCKDLDPHYNPTNRAHVSKNVKSITYETFVKVQSKLSKWIAIKGNQILGCINVGTSKGNTFFLAFPVIWINENWEHV